jgi:NIMA (never in mitosis gene a)-related kinase
MNSKKYKIIEEIGKGKGGFGKVYKVEKEKKLYAIKKICLNEKSKEEIDKIQNEANILSNINNEHIIKFHDSYQDKDAFYILMEYCDGKDLRDLINEYKEQKKQINENLIFNMVLDICLGIKEIHKHNIIHRDLKPENLFRLNDNTIKIGDFGVSKQLESNKKSASTQVGTENYAAPEIYTEKKYTNKVDIWALGCIIYELLTLKYCFENAYDMCIKLNNNEKYGIIDNNKYNSKWQDLIDLLLKKDYNERPNIDEIYNFLIKEFKNIKKIIRLKPGEMSALKKTRK